jgi:hypothetical protein
MNGFSNTIREGLSLQLKTALLWERGSHKQIVRMPQYLQKKLPELVNHLHQFLEQYFLLDAGPILLPEVSPTESLD